LIKDLGNKCLDEISMIQVEGYKQRRLKSVTRRGMPRSPSTINRELELLSGIFTLASDGGIVVPNPCRKAKKLDEDNQRNRYLSDEEEDRLISKLTGVRAHVRPLVRLAILTLMRKNELLQLRWANIDFTREVIYVMNSRRERTKSKRSRIIPMSPEVKQILLALHRQVSTSEYVFTNPATGKPYVDIKKAFAWACNKAKIKDFWFHDLRRTGATRLGEAGVDAFYIATLLGHADIHTSQIYTVATNEGLRHAMNSLAARENRTDAKVPTVKEQRPMLAAVSL